ANNGVNLGKQQVKEYLDTMRRSARRHLADFEVPEGLIDGLLKEGEWTADKALSYQRKLAEHLGKARGKETAASFRVGGQLSWVYGSLAAEDKAPGAIDKDAFRTQLEKAREAGYDAGYPRELFDVLDRAADRFASGRSGEGKALVEELMLRLDTREGGLKFF